MRPSPTLEDSVNMTSQFAYLRRRQVYEAAMIGYLLMFIFGFGLMFAAILHIVLPWWASMVLGLTLVIIAVLCRLYLKHRFKKGLS